MSKNFKRIYIAFIIIFIGFFPFMPRFFINCDGQFYMARVEALYRNIKNGIVLPSIQFGNIDGFSYMEEMFYPGLLYYLPAILRFIMPISIAFYISLALYKAIAIFLTIKLGKKYFEDDKVYKFTLLYYSNIIFLYDTLIRESYSEYMASLFLPLVFLGIYEVYKKQKGDILFIGMSMMLATHIISLYLSTGLVAVYGIINIKEIKKWFKPLMFAALKTFAVGAYFLIPFVYYFKGYTVTIMNNAPITIQKPTDILYVIGFALFIGVLIFLTKKVKNFKYFTPILIFGYFMTPLFPFEVFSIFYLLQFKRRLLMFLAIYIILMFLKFCSTKYIKFFLILFALSGIILTFMTNYMKTFLETEKFEYSEGYTGEYTLDTKFADFYMAFVNGEFIPAEIETVQFDESYMDVNIWYKEILEKFNENSFIEEVSHTDTTLTVITDKEEGRVRKVYYPLYKAYQESNEKITLENNKGFLYAKNVIPNEPFTIYYENTLIQYVSLIFSIISLGLLISRRYICKKKS